jgi:hypothetical protein
MNEYTVRVRDRRQGVVQKATQLAKSQREANKRFLRYLHKAFRHKNFEVL